MAYRRRRPRFGTTGCLFWLFILLVIVVIFLFRGKGNLKESFSFFKKLRKTGQEVLFREKKQGAKGERGSPDVQGSTREAAPGGQPGEKPGVTPGEVPVEGPGTKTGAKPGIQYLAEPGAEPRAPPRQEASKKPGSGGAGATQGAETAAARPKPAPEAAQTKKGEIKAKSLATSLYFVRIDGEDGSVKPVPVERTIEYKDSPITKTFEALLRGPTEGERNKGMISLIPEGTRLLSARIDEGHLTLNFSHHFEENYTGREAILLELSQVVLTSFDFNQVTKVSIRIEGKQKRYITGEGIPLKEAYTKQDLSSLKPES